ncbi:sulfatase-like hydrolase/transferase [Maribellus comscasis]|uniref:Sulfatase-like hydrolase/transferase n=1 Tax=Maribellus comscasis TaxID=2681766 RepID=A0A6I6JWF3_9BACT|nr:arylsulfatase [Maribellus comscasis]QGY45428.1 sulfatase-like hydrolase/transferase [Maribellus comscasis]
MQKINSFFYSILLTALAFFLFGCEQTDNVETSKPNIIYILADDLGYAEVGCYGQEKIETPNIDALATHGMRFTQHYAGAPVCAPSRCVLLTGKHLGHAQIRGNDEWAARGDVWNFEAMAKDPNLEGQRPLKPGTKTIGRLLQNAGYKTGVVGKWGLGAPLTEGIPNKQGFDFFFGYNCQRQAHTYFPVHLWKDTTKVLLNNKMVPPRTKLPEGADLYDPDSYKDYWLSEYSPELMQNEVLNFIEENKDQPFFMYYATPIPHNPLQAPKRWVDYYVEKFGDEEPYDGSKGYFPHRYPHACYAAMVSYFDEQVGEIVAKLKELGLYENTIIMFSSDNGPTYTGGADSPWFDSAKPFKSEGGWGKGNVTEGGIRVPMIVQWPGNIEAGSETDLISAFYDVLPTICDVVQIDTPDEVDGVSFLPTLLGKGEQEKHRFLYWEFPASGGQQAIRMGQWKGIRKNIFKDSMQVQLYNLESDIQELNDVSAKYPEVVKEIEAIFKQEHIPAEIERFKIKQLGDSF